MVLIYWLSMWWLVRGDRPQEVATFEAHGDLAGLMQLRPSDESEAKLAERNAAFDTLWRRYFSHYRHITGRSMPGLKHWEIPVQYEFEIYNNMYHMEMTPEMLLVRGRIEHPSLVADFPEAFESTPLWDIGIDGYGSDHSQSINGCPEAASVWVRPETVLNGTLAHELVQHMRNKMHVPDGRKKDSFQFTFGIQLERISDLMKRTRSMQKRVKETRKFCKSRQQPCSRRYEGLMLLCQMVLDHAVNANHCGFPKRFQTPWLLRTHVGDLAMTLHKDERSHLANDVLKLWGRDCQLYPKGIMDYLNFPEMAEVGGVVKKRIGKSDATIEMPTDLEGLKKVARMMLEDKHKWEVGHRLAERTCTLNAPGNKTWFAPTAREWLEGVQKGLDLMSDHDSPAAQASLSKNLWKSMGSWRLSKEEPRTFLECRSVTHCLNLDPKSWRRMSYNEKFQAAARFAHHLEQLPL